ncbi:hypothetical protein [Olsenella profusa]|uniref:NlpC/P60 domain-containing protein n=1 Tax=Olsenella profusa TaxID=138595 RepID=A0ABS2F063_9ACTN|nr:hypothetical protein [Olsenella profusa]MBM6774369.1 hypothetical protein [Olsenella profusa]
MGTDDDMRGKVLAALAARGLLAEDGATTTYGQPAWRDVPSEGGPQGLMDANALQRRLVACAHATPATGPDQCATWVENVLASVGTPYVCGSARAIYEGFCHVTDLSGLLVGMVVAVGRHPFDASGWAHGHVGLYVGDACVMDCAGGRVRTAPLAAWLSVYGVASEPRWGWLGTISLG